RDLEVVGGSHRRRPHPVGDPATAGDVDLQAVDRLGGQHPVEVGKVVAVFASGDVRGDLIAHLPQPSQVVGRDRLFKPGDVVVGHGVGHADRLLAPVTAIGIDVKCGVGSDNAAGQGNS